ncbi:MAG: hypothetical protein QOF37_112 [Thermoleophilaceae bacterium]|nr:hypothetical protein [Thermoleophilaceae bacterium]
MAGTHSAAPRGRRKRLIGAVLLLMAVAVALVIWLVPGPKRGPVEAGGPTSRASFASGGLGEFSQVNRLHGTLATTPGPVHGHSRSALATYDGSGANGYARGIYNVHWKQGADVAYSAAFYIPRATLAAVKGQVALMRWDDYPAHPEAANYGGVVIFVGDHRAHLIRNELGLGGAETDLTGPFDLPLDRWFTLEVRQRLGAGNARNEVYVDGRLIARSLVPNIPGDRDVERVRYGIAAIASGAQTAPLRLWFDDATAWPGAVSGH